MSMQGSIKGGKKMKIIYFHVTGCIRKTDFTSWDSSPTIENKNTSVLQTLLIAMHTQPGDLMRYLQQF